MSKAAKDVSEKLESSSGSPDYLKRQTDTPNKGAIKAANPDAPVDGAFNAEAIGPPLSAAARFADRMI